jgi:hypothetical protein
VTFKKTSCARRYSLAAHKELHFAETWLPFSLNFVLLIQQHIMLTLFPVLLKLVVEVFLRLLQLPGGH